MCVRDGCGREIDYLRLSVTDRCNYRCRYCMPPQGVPKKAHEDILTLEELEEIAWAAVGCGVKKIRLTGVEMEALTAVSVAALTIYDMCKAAQKDMRITNIRLLEKSGGKSGDYKIKE